jgi:nickel-dependent lactate racemase
MQAIEFPFGSGFVTLNLDLEPAAEVLMPELVPGVPDELAAIRDAISRPIGSRQLQDLARGKSSVAIVINDITRPSPTEAMLTVIVEKLAQADIPLANIAVLVATGNHVPPTEEELKTMMGVWRSKLKIVIHDCKDTASVTYMGTTGRGMPVYVNKHYAEASLKILTGVIAPHQSAGFGGGRKSVVPGICGLETLRTHHSFPIRPAVPILGIIKDNTFHEEAVAAARLTGVDFIVNVVKNFRGQVVEAVAGDLEAAHMAGVAICEKSWVRKFTKAYDVVFASPGRYPKDIDLHQAQKGMAVAEQITKPGGTIVLIAECRNGVGKFGKVLKQADSVDMVIRDFYAQGFTPDQNSKAYMFARCCKSHRVFVVSSGIDPKEVAEMFMTGFTSVAEAAAAALSSYDRPSVLCIPYAGDCIPVVESAATAAGR